MKATHPSLYTALAVLLCLSVCTANARDNPLSEGGKADGAPQAVHTECTQAQSLAEAVHAVPIDLESVRSTLKAVQTDNPTLIYAEQLNGRCAQLLSGFQMSHMFFGDSIVLESVDQTHFVVGQVIRYQDVVAMTALDPHPKIMNRGTFVMAALMDVSSDDGVAGDFIGLWRDRTESSLHAFSRDQNGFFSEPKHILSSSLPLRSVSYFPAPDTAAGRLGLVQEDGNEIRTLSLDWAHTHLFERRAAYADEVLSPEEDIANERIANDIATAIANHAGLTILPGTGHQSPIGGYSPTLPVFQVPVPPRGGDGGDGGGGSYVP